MLNLIFDFDGVIGDTRNAYIYAHIKTGGASNESEAKSNISDYTDNKPNHTRKHTLNETELEEFYKTVQGLGKCVNEHGLELFTDFINQIKLINSEHLAVISSGSQIYVLPALAKVDLKFTHILAYEDHHSKEEKIEIVCKDWGIEVSEVYYFTDTLADVYELQNFIHPDKLIGVSWGYCSTEQLLTQLKPENILDSPTDLPKLLAR